LIVGIGLAAGAVRNQRHRERVSSPGESTLEAINDVELFGVGRVASQIWCKKAD
jgi:hypothetical protein